VDGVVIRAFHPDAVRVECLRAQAGPVSLTPLEPKGFFGLFLPDLSPPMRYRLRYHFADGRTWELYDPYSFLPTLGDLDLHLFNEGNHRRLWRHLGAHRREVDGIGGASFSVWAPNARRVSVVGDFCGWDGRILPMRQMGSSGVFELFVPGVEPGARYKYEIKTRDGNLRLKCDPYGQAMEQPPATASLIPRSAHRWGDGEWLKRATAR
jgi:1,4-alpha-glucan branching enzyme